MKMTAQKRTSCAITCGLAGFSMLLLKSLLASIFSYMLVLQISAIILFGCFGAFFWGVLPLSKRGAILGLLGAAITAVAFIYDPICMGLTVSDSFWWCLSEFTVAYILLIGGLMLIGCGMVSINKIFNQRYSFVVKLIGLVGFVGGGIVYAIAVVFRSATIGVIGTWLVAIASVAGLVALINLFKNRADLIRDIDLKMQSTVKNVAVVSARNFLPRFAYSIFILGAIVMIAEIIFASPSAETVYDELVGNSGNGWSEEMLINGVLSMVFSVLFGFYILSQVKVNAALVSAGARCKNVLTPRCLVVMTWTLYLSAVLCLFGTVWSFAASNREFSDCMTRGLLRNMSFGMFVQLNRISQVMNARVFVSLMMLFSGWYCFGLGKFVSLIRENTLLAYSLKDK